ncbi:cytidylate kinase-like family protein [Desulforhopalus sp. 52FAK]
MSSIAIFPCRHTPAENIAHALASRLTLKIYTDENLVADTAAASGVSVDKLRKAMFGKTSVFNKFTLEREKSINLLRQTLQQKLDSTDQFLFEGFLTSLIPSSIKHVLKVLVVASQADRIAYAVASGMSEKQAQKSRKDFDKLAYSWTDFLFGKEAYDSSLYDLVIPVDQKTDEELVEATLKCFHTTSVLRTNESQQAVKDIMVGAKIEHNLLEKGHKVDIIIEGGDVTLTVQEDVFNFKKLEEELVLQARQVEGVGTVTVKQSPSTKNSIYRRQKFELPSKVLFVDDEKEFVKTVSERLISRDVGTYGVYDGETALEVVSEDQPDVMVLDLKMPGLHGVEVLRRTKELASEVEVIILTGHGTMDDMQQCMELGAFAYMNKPVDIEELSDTIKAASEKAAAAASKNGTPENG